MKRTRRAATPAATPRRRGGSSGGASRKAAKGDELKRFWGDPGATDTPIAPTRPTHDPSAIVRSLGPPPLVGQDRAAEAYFALVYEKAVGLASALAAANGLLQVEEPEPDL